MHFGLLAVGMFPPLCLGVGTEAVKGFGVARPKTEVARHQRHPPVEAFVYQGPALGDVELGYSRGQGSQAPEGRKWADQRRLEEFSQA